ncbi:MAG: VCBS repeat-containing protein [Planctomycetes bacterium]|nr:VCBS repeat-containing protein [Planctomycetota bacterium]
MNHHGILRIVHRVFVVTCVAVAAMGARADAQVSFRAAEVFASPDAGVSAVSVALGDFDGDGHVDVVQATVSPLAVHVFRGDAGGSLTPVLTSSFPTSLNASNIVAADFDGDLRLDFAVAGNSSDLLWFAFGDGTGSFPTTRSTYVSELRLIAVADFDRDGDVDVAAVADTHVFVLDNDGAGNFTRIQTLTAPRANATALAVADVNGDSYPDLVESWAQQSSFSVLATFLNNGSGSFVPGPAPPSLGTSGVLAIGAGDFDLDGDDDVVVADGFAIRLLLADGAGGFVAGAPISARGDDLDAVDFDGDGHLDVVQAGDGRVRVFLGDGAGGLSLAGEWVSGNVRYVRGAQLDGDGRLDLVCSLERGVSVLHGSPSGLIAADELPIQTPPGTSRVDLVSGDFDGDGRVDFATTGYSTTAGHFLTGVLSTGPGTFAPQIDSPICEAGRLGVGDFDLDGDDDVVVPRDTGACFYEWSGASGFVPRSTYPLDGTESGQQVVVADFDEDGRPDVGAMFGTYFVWFRWNETGPFERVRGFLLPGFCVAVADVDEDGHLDLVSDDDQVGLVVRSGDGDGRFAPARVAGPGKDSVALAAGDLDGDGHVDIVRVAASSETTFDVLVGDGSGAFTVRQSRILLPFVDNAVNGAPVVADFDRDGFLDVAILTNVAEIYSGDGTGRLSNSHAYGVGNAPRFAVLADPDVDGRPDLVVANTGSPDVDILYNRSRGCGSGNVNGAAGPPENVLLVNGSSGDASRTVVVPRNVPIAVHLSTSSSGPATASYALWAWKSPPISATDVVVAGRVVGCAVNPIPRVAPRSPQPFRCFHAASIDPSLCGAVPPLGTSPPAAPFTLTKPSGLRGRATITLQGVLEDAGSTSVAGFSVTNATILRVD